VLIIARIINVHSAGISWEHLNATPAARTLSIKLIFVIISGGAAALHEYRATPTFRNTWPRTRGMAVGGLAGLSLLAATMAALFGVVIAQS